MGSAAETPHASAQYTKKALPLRFTRWALRREQTKIYARYARAFPPRRGERILDLGVNGSLVRPEQHFFEWLHPFREGIVAAGLEPPELFRRCFPELEYVQLGRDGPLPFAERSFDVVFVSAVVEHVGSRDRQRAFLAEVARVGKAAFVTTPNRWFPVELHTVLPLVHWLPARWFRALIGALGFTFFAREENLNLLDRRALAGLVPPGVEATISRHRFLGLTSNLLLTWKARDERSRGGAD